MRFHVLTTTGLSSRAGAWSAALLMLGSCSPSNSTSGRSEQDGGVETGRGGDKSEPWRLADRFVYPVIPKSEPKIRDNFTDPTTDNWTVAGNDFGNYYCYDSSTPTRCYHPGEDWNIGTGDDLGVTVYSVANGAVRFAGKVGTGLGEGVIIEHILPNSEDLRQYALSGTTVKDSEKSNWEKKRLVLSGYLHLSDLLVASGDVVKIGQPIGKIAEIEGAGPHLHFEMRTRFTGSFCKYGETAQELTDRWMIHPRRFLAAHTYSVTSARTGS